MPDVLQMILTCSVSSENPTETSAQKAGKISLGLLLLVTKHKKFCLVWDKGNAEFVTIVFSDFHKMVQVINNVHNMNHVICLAYCGNQKAFHADTKS